MSRKRSNRKPRPVWTNPIEVAIESARKLPADDVEKLKAALHRALGDFRKGIECPRNWADLADAMNMAEALSLLGILADEDSKRWFQRAQDALSSVRDRCSATGSWTLRAPEVDALVEGLFLHDIQLRFCSLGEFDRARQIVTNRCSQALAGNAGPGVKVVRAA
jgi:hypothetical protein